MIESRCCPVVPKAVWFRAWTPEDVVAECLVGSQYRRAKQTLSRLQIMPVVAILYSWRQREKRHSRVDRKMRCRRLFQVGRCAKNQRISLHIVRHANHRGHAHVSCVVSILTSWTSSKKSFRSTGNSCSCERPICIPYFRTATAIVP